MTKHGILDNLMCVPWFPFGFIRFKHGYQLWKYSGECLHHLLKCIESLLHDWIQCFELVVQILDLRPWLKTTLDLSFMFINFVDGTMLMLHNHFHNTIQTICILCFLFYSTFIDSMLGHKTNHWLTFCNSSICSFSSVWIVSLSFSMIIINTTNHQINQSIHGHHKTQPAVIVVFQLVIAICPEHIQWYTFNTDWKTTPNLLQLFHTIFQIKLDLKKKHKWNKQVKDLYCTTMKRMLTWWESDNFCWSDDMQS